MKFIHVRAEMKIHNALSVFYIYPKKLPSGNITILSFLKPGEEEKLRSNVKNEVISAREIAPSVKELARRIYIDLVAEIGTAKVKGRTLRSALKNNEDFSLWWLHKFSEKDCEVESTFKFIIEILIIKSVADKYNFREIILNDCFKELADVLGSYYSISKINCRLKYDIKYFLKQGFSRLKYLFVIVLEWIAVQNVIKETPKCSLDIILLGFWNWSINEDKKTGRPVDLYFRSLPDRLMSKGLKSGWFLWFDPYDRQYHKIQMLKKSLRPTIKYNNLIVLQKFIKLTDIFRAILNINPLIVLFSFFKDKYFKKIFIKQGMDFMPIIKAPLMYGCIDANLPCAELIYHATKRAFKIYQPKIAISFLEFLIYSRAFYLGGKKGNKDVITCAIQHASYSREKTFGLLHPDIEYRGNPDNCCVPAPDYIFAMGQLGKDIFMENGFSENRVILTGSPRYEHISASNIKKKNESNNIKNILIVTSLDIDIEFEMIDAVINATKDMRNIKLFLRSHPFKKITYCKQFKTYKNQVTATNVPLEEDLNNADLVIFSYSTVAEEAFIKGIPILQWCSTSHNSSVFRDLKVIPSFNSVKNLRKYIKEFILNPNIFIPDDKTRSYVLKNCFNCGDGKESDRIAEYIVSNILNN